MGSTLREYSSPRKRNLGLFVANTWQHLPHLLLEVRSFFDRYFHIPLPIVTKHKLGLPFPPRNLPIKFGTNPSTIFFVIVVTERETNRQTDRQTDTQTNAGKTYPIAFAGRKNKGKNKNKNRLAQKKRCGQKSVRAYQYAPCKL